MLITAFHRFIISTMKEKAFSIIRSAATAVFALALIALFSLIILIPMPDAVLRAIGWIAIISGAASAVLAAVGIRSR